MTPTHGTVLHGKEAIGFQVLFVPRKTMEIAVHPDSSVVVRAPNGIGLDDVKKRVIRRAGWIRRQQGFFSQFEPRTPPRRYVGGETHLYLGGRYRLKVLRGARESVKLARGYLRVTIPKGRSTDRVRLQLEEWYAQRAAARLARSLEECWARWGQSGMPGSGMPILKIQHMKRQWGSLSKLGRLTLNPDLVRAPRECIEYVIAHELCHLRFPHHGPAFFRLLKKMMPDWEKRKTRLERGLV